MGGQGGLGACLGGGQGATVCWVPLMHTSPGSLPVWGTHSCLCNVRSGFMETGPGWAYRAGEICSPAHGVKGVPSRGVAAGALLTE